ncbi:hypothetical protein CCR75_001440 [Bremia lactucae]|uniref:tRNA/rRNA methyltransferase SpoU type domain-containing protein n=1 Tax=Bremia lactucae TaxID=4779 RepID=A0A976IM25_BRELC|nr:hypothetical protein CCR75_001440 [Bremia lactucae]
MEVTVKGADARTITPRHYLILNNVQKIKNVKNMLMSASAFGVKEVFVVGQKKFDLQEQASFLNSLSCRTTRVATLKDCRALCNERSIQIIGVEIMHDAKSIVEEPFNGDTAFIMGNEVGGKRVGAGMNSAQMAICDQFVYIPQYGGGTASLNVTVAASIVLQRFALWAKLPIAETLHTVTTTE